MKSYKLFLIGLLLLSGISLKAQFFVDGSIRFSTSGYQNNETTPAHKNSSYSLDLKPGAGKFLSDKLAVGVDLDISLSGNKTNINNETETRTSGIGVTPFLRYYAFRWNKFSVFGQGYLGLDFSGTRVDSGGTITKGPKNTRISLGVFPGLAYDLTDNLSLQTSLNILNLGFSYVITKEGSTKTNSANFNIGAGISNIIALNAITIGAIYKF